MYIFFLVRCITVSSNINIERSIKKFVRKFLMGNIESWKNSEFINVQIKKVLCIIFYIYLRNYFSYYI